MSTVPSGTRLRVYWTGERRWYKGVVTASRVEESRRIHHIKYDDGDSKWHDLGEEIWLLLDDAGSSKGSGNGGRPKAASAKSTDHELTPAPSVTADSDKGKPRVNKPPRKSSPRSRKTSAAASQKGAARNGAARVQSETLPAGSWRPRRPDETPPKGREEQLPAGPPLVHVAPENVEVLPCGVVKLKGVLSAAAQQRLWDGVMCAGFDYRAVEGEVNQGANTWYTKTAGAPDMLLHYQMSFTYPNYELHISHE